MATSVPDALKSVKPYLARADELDKDISREESKIVAYYCRQYAMDMGLQLRDKGDPAVVNKFLGDLINRLESDKSKFLAPVSQELGKSTVTQFALEVFDKADQEDREGRANKNTSRTFYAASLFFDVLNQFGDLDFEVGTKRKYSKWKSAEIIKAIREGRPIVPGGPSEQEDASLAAELANLTPGGSEPAPGAAAGGGFPPAAAAAGGAFPPAAAGGALPPAAPAAADSFGIPQAPTTPAAQAPPVYPGSAPSPAYRPPHATPAPVQHTIPIAPAPPVAFMPRAGSVNQTKINDAIELAKFAVRALETNDVGTAVQRLHGALQSLN